MFAQLAPAIDQVSLYDVACRNREELGIIAGMMIDDYDLRSALEG